MTLTSVEHVAGGEVLGAGARLTTSVPGDRHAALAPVAARIVGTGRVTLLNGQDVPAVEIEPMASDLVSSSTETDLDVRRRLQEAVQSARAVDLPVWIDRFRDAGVWADRRCSPDLLAQLYQAIRRPLDSVICNVLDGDPNSCIQSTVSTRNPAHVVAAVALLGKLTGARNVWIVVEAGSPPAWWDQMRRLCRGQFVRLIWLTNDYPQSDPTLLLYTLLNRRLRPGRLPTEQGVIMLDAAAALAIGRCAAIGAPMLDAPLAVRDHAMRLTHFISAPIGMNVAQILSQLGIDRDRPTVRGGDVLRDERAPLDAVFGGTESVIHVTGGERVTNPDPCIRCGWCVEMCPTRIHPAGLLEASQRRSLPLGERYGLDACIECGICSYVCPSRLPLLEGIRTLKVLRSES
ncbi:MAG: 4Fe-4S binding protein [Tepidisphaeraceae bacterium]